MQSNTESFSCCFHLLFLFSSCVIKINMQYIKSVICFQNIESLARDFFGYDHETQELEIVKDVLNVAPALPRQFPAS